MKFRNRIHAVPLILFFFLFASFAYFNHDITEWNVNTRLALTYAIVEEGRLSIDSYHNSPVMPNLETNDKAFFKGHFYCDKSPALSFAAAPFYALLWHSKMDLGIGTGFSQPRWIYWTGYLLRTLTVSLPAALLGVLLWAIARRLGVSSRLAAFLALGLLWGTLLGSYATLFYPYLPSACCLAAAYALLLDLRLKTEENPTSSPPSRSLPPPSGWRLFGIGLLVGCGWFLEFTSGLVGLALSVYALWTFRRTPLTLWRYVAGGLIPVAFFYTYAWSIFGEFSIPYKYEFDDFFREQMNQGFNGIHWPRLAVLYYITVHPYRGLFFFSPVLLLALPGLAALVSRRASHPFRPDLALAAFVIVAYFAFASGYYMWWGGQAAGARNLCPAISFFVIPLSLFLSRKDQWKRVVFGVLLVLSLILSFMITAQSPQIKTLVPEEKLLNAQIRDNLPSPALHYTYPAFLAGYVADNLCSELFGVQAGWSLAPLALLTLLALTGVIVCGKPEPEIENETQVSPLVSPQPDERDV
jgi:hypothetical protein